MTAMIVEPVQGEAGFVIPPAEFLQRLRRICERHGILLIFDEIQTGFGRTGQMFAAQTFGVAPGAASPDDIWDFCTREKDKYEEVLKLGPLVDVLGER